MLSRAEREQYLGQHGKVLWFTGLSGSGKSTLAIQLERDLFGHGYFAQVLDGDNIRMGLNHDLGFSDADRRENIRRIAEVSRLFCEAGIITICAFVSPTEELRALARRIIGANDFLEIYVSTPLEVCEQRDVKGLYQKAREGALPEFTGISAPYEIPRNPWLEIPTHQLSVGESVTLVLDALLSHIESVKRDRKQD
ncbi:MAG TPA: adenylyl-sulfate kinase [Saprospiraceae bacterium]|nr:adenylyl-sulfate kinase [Saprospiraceae bacterium]